jgi:hypothetical protein
MDTYSKVILTVIMFLLLMILIKPGIVTNAKAGYEIQDVNIKQVGGRFITNTLPVSVK